MNPWPLFSLIPVFWDLEFVAEMIWFGLALSWIPNLKYGKPFGVRRFIAALGTAYWLDQAACCREFHKPLGLYFQAI